MVPAFHLPPPAPPEPAGKPSNTRFWATIAFGLTVIGLAVLAAIYLN